MHEHAMGYILRFSTVFGKQTSWALLVSRMERAKAADEVLAFELARIGVAII